MASKNLGRSLTESGHKSYAQEEFHKARKTERRLVRVFCKKYDAPESEEYFLRSLRTKHGICGWRDIHCHDNDLLVQYFTSRIGMSVDNAVSDLFQKYPALGYKDRHVRKETMSLIESTREIPCWYDPFSIDEDGMIREPVLAPWLS